MELEKSLGGASARASIHNFELSVMPCRDDMHGEGCFLSLHALIRVVYAWTADWRPSTSECVRFYALMGARIVVGEEVAPSRAARPLGLKVEPSIAPVRCFSRFFHAIVELNRTP